MPPTFSGLTSRKSVVMRRVRELNRWVHGWPGAADEPRRPFTAMSGSALTVALLMIAIVLLIGFLLPTSQHLGSLLVVVPATTAALAGPRLTAAVAALSCGGALALDAYDGLLQSSIWAVHLLTILLVSGLVIGFRAIRERNVSELLDVRTVSETIQRVLLRPLPGRLGSLRMRSAYHASQPHALIGGDLYAAAKTPTGVRLVIGDVKGKGLLAIDDAATLLGAFRAAPHARVTLPELMAYLEGTLRSHFRDSAMNDSNAGERFVTALVLDLPDDGGHVRMVSCGHPPPYLVEGQAADLMPVGRPSPPLGLSSLLAEEYAVDTFPLSADATLFLYTDGAIEARDAAGRFFDLGARLAAWSGSEPGELIEHVLDGLLAHVGGERHLDDDIAMVALQRDAAR
jgi:serine phosphatase RsbU (regulator of sigma subunit)